MICNLKTTMVGNILTQCKCSISMHSVKYHNIIEEIYQHLCSFIKSGSILRCPPVGKITIFIKLPALIIKAMCHFMSNNNTNSTIVYSIITIHIEKWGLQYSRGEAYLI